MTTTIPIVVTSPADLVQTGLVASLARPGGNVTGVGGDIRQTKMMALLTGHKTRAVFDRYHIVSPGDLQDVARRLAGTISGTFGVQPLDSRPVNRRL